MDEREARLQLSCVVEAGDAAMAEQIALHGPEKVWAAVFRGRDRDTGAARRARQLDLDVVLRIAKVTNARFIIPGDDEWPEGLDVLAVTSPWQGMGGLPIGLWVRGPKHLGELCARSVAIVGARAATSYGKDVATDFAAELSQSGVTIVSGGAYGIDDAAHKGALAVSGPTVAVLARGCDDVYPVGNAAMLGWVVQREAMVSEVPLGQAPTRFRFLSRNRLIAAMTQATIIVEAAARSGARNTATWATLCGRPLMAVPGPVHAATSVTPHRLIRDHEAELVATVADIHDVLAPLGQSPLPIVDRGADREVDALSGDDLAVFEAVPGRGGLSAGEVSLGAGVPIAKTLSCLERLLEAGWVQVTHAGLWRIARVPR